MPKERVIAVGLLTESDLDRLDEVLIKLWPVEEAPSFSELLQAIDEADAKLCFSSNLDGEAGPKGD